MTWPLEQKFILMLSRKNRWRGLKGRILLGDRKTPKPKPGEVAVSLTVKMAESLFSTPALSALLEVDERHVVKGGVEIKQEAS